MREYSTPLTIEIPDHREPHRRRRRQRPRGRRRGRVQPPRSTAGWERRHRRRVPRRGPRGRQGPGRRRHRGRRPGRPDLQDPLRVDAARLRDLVRRRGHGARLRDLVRRADRAGSCSDSGARAVVAESAGAPRPDRGGPRRPRASSTTSGRSTTTPSTCSTRLGADIADDELEARRTAATPLDLATLIYTSGHHRPAQGLHAHPRQLHVRARRRRRRARRAVRRRGRRPTLLFLPLAHVFARIIQVGCVKAAGPAGPQRRHQEPGRRPRRLPADVHPRRAAGLREGLQHRLPARRPPTAAAGSSTGPPRPRSPTRRGLDARAARRSRCAPSTRCSPGWSTRKLRDALGGRCAYAVSGGAPLGERLGHFYRGIGLTVLEGYGLTETTAALTVNLPDAHKIGTVGRPLPGHRGPGRRRRRAAVPRRPGLRRLLGQRGGHRARRSSATAGSTPATSARSTTRASSGSPAARRRSW